MRLDDNSRVQLIVTDLRVDIDPTAGTLVLAVDGTEYPCTWDGAAVNTGGIWTRAAHSSQHFAGPAVPSGQVAGAIVLAYGVHTTELRLAIADTIVAVPTGPIRVSVS